jgi:hypothetical protein
MFSKFVAFSLGVLLSFPAFAQDARQAVVFDIDGTLTPNVYAVTIARTGAAQAATLYADAGIDIIYLTARIRPFQGGVADWPSDHGFPAGDLYLTETKADRDDHAAFKQRVLTNYVNQGGTIIAAFGDSSSDFAAYADVGIPRENVFALQRFGRSNCKEGVWQGCYENWTDLLPVITANLTK